jgi:hypothetical protein
MSKHQSSQHLESRILPLSAEHNIPDIESDKVIRSEGTKGIHNVSRNSAQRAYLLRPVALPNIRVPHSTWFPKGCQLLGGTSDHSAPVAVRNDGNESVQLRGDISLGFWPGVGLCEFTLNANGDFLPLVFILFLFLFTLIAYVYPYFLLYVSFQFFLAMSSCFISLYCLHVLRSNFHISRLNALGLIFRMILV